jgi:CheY-like chemotaxis protein
MAQTRACIVVAEDEAKWYEPMLERLQMELGRRHHQSVDKAELPEPLLREATQEVLATLRSQPVRMLSLDLKMPSIKGAEVSQEFGRTLAESRPLQRLMGQTIGYSATLVAEYPESYRQDFVRSVPNVYSKTANNQHAPHLNVIHWAELVTQCAVSNELETTDLRDNEGNLLRPMPTALGRWFDQAGVLLPPMLAKLSVQLHNAWAAEQTAARLDAAVKFIEAVSLLALAQTAVAWEATCTHPLVETSVLPIDDQPSWPKLPMREGQGGVLQSLRQGRACLEAALQARGLACNWLGWLQPGTVGLLHKANDLRNRMRHDLNVRDTGDDWEALLPCLRHTMDLATYWGLHPLCLNVGRDGKQRWQAEFYAGRGLPSPRQLLDDGIRVPAAAEALAQRGLWQSMAWRSVNDVHWELHLVPWSQQLQRGDAFAQWLTAWQSDPDAQGKRANGQFNLLDGQYRIHSH